MTEYLTKGEVCWRSPSNIAFVKYWGKRGNQIPRNPSLSMTLENSYTEMKVAYEKNGSPEISYHFQGQKEGKFEERIRYYIRNLYPHLPYLKDYSLKIESFNTFPHSAGIASSASAFSALALCLCSIGDELGELCTSEEEFCRKASFLARLGSGSACRSVFGPFAIWGKTTVDKNSSDEYAIIPSIETSAFYIDLCDAILIVSSDMKKISSSEGHKMMQMHPFAGARYRKAAKNVEKMMEIMKNGNHREFFELLEHEAFALHALMMVSSPPTLLLHPNSLFIIDLIRDLRERENLKIGFTIDAGPNIHLIYHKNDRKKIIRFVEQDIKIFLENGQWIDDKAGMGPTRMR